VSNLIARLRTIPSWQITLGVALLALGFLIAAQLAAEGPRVRYTTQERSPLIETALGLQSRQEELKATILELRSRTQELEREGQGSAELVRRLNRDLEQARIAAGLIPLSGTGIVFQLEDSSQGPPAGGNSADYRVTARDIRTMIEELWLAGAEAIAVNGERVTTTTAVIDIGPSVLVNSAYLAPPYQVSALGPGDLLARLQGMEGFTDFIRARSQGYGIRVSFYEPERVDIPAYAGTISLRYARVIPASPSPRP
jgi:uncharacterized protein YlxW (UPF0749 family)